MRAEHQFIVLYDTGGTQEVCTICGMATPWHRTGEDGGQDESE
jgi:hypothetical protein